MIDLFIVRDGSVRGKGDYFSRQGWTDNRRIAKRYVSESDARGDFEEYKGPPFRIVRLVPRRSLSKREKGLLEALTVAENVLFDLSEHGNLVARLALPKVQPVLGALSPKAAKKRAPVMEMLLRPGTCEIKGAIPHWAMGMIGASLAESMQGVPNYMTATLTGGEFVVTVTRRNGKTPHDLRVDAEAREAAALVRTAKAEELLAAATSLKFGGYLALRICAAPPAEVEIWRVRSPDGGDVVEEHDGSFRVDRTRDEAISLARELAAKAKEQTP